MAPVVAGLIPLLANGAPPEAATKDSDGQVWGSPLPADCPFQASQNYSGVTLTGRHAEYGNADTWYPCWAADGNLYSSWTDGYLLEDAPSRHQIPYDFKNPPYYCTSGAIVAGKTATAQAKIVGEDPLQLSIVNLAPRVQASPAPYPSRYPCGGLIYNGVWYYGTYSLEDSKVSKCGGVGWTLMGPFVGFRWSTDLGKTWTETPCTPGKPLFGENPALRPVKIGEPHFVDFGKNMGNSPDGYAYLLAQGSTRPEAWNNWIQADQVYLLRVKPAIATMNDPAAYEFFGGYTAQGTALWTHDFNEIKPLLEWPGHLGCVTATYNPSRKKYFMCISRCLSETENTVLLLESTQLTGPWKVVSYLNDFGPAGYFLNIPSKFISRDGKTFWLCYSANWAGRFKPNGNPQGSDYGLCLREMRLVEKTN